MDENSGGDSSAADKLENSILSIQNYVDKSNSSLVAYKRMNKILTLLILIVLASFGTILYFVITDNFSREKFRTEAIIQLDGDIVPSAKGELKKFSRTHGDELQKKFEKESEDLMENFEIKMTDKFKDLSEEVGGKADEILQDALKNILNDQKETLVNLFPELKDDQKLDDFTHDFLLRIEDDNKIIIDELHDEYLYRMADIKDKVGHLGREKFHTPKHELQIEVVHSALQLLDKEFKNYIYENHKEGAVN